MASRGSGGFAQPLAGAFQLGDEEDEDEGAAAATPPPAHVHFAVSPFAAVASASPASSVAGEDAESRRACCRLRRQLLLSSIMDCCLPDRSACWTTAAVIPHSLVVAYASANAKARN